MTDEERAAEISEAYAADIADAQAILGGKQRYHVTLDPALVEAAKAAEPDLSLSQIVSRALRAMPIEALKRDERSLSELLAENKAKYGPIGSIGPETVRQWIEEAERVKAKEELRVKELEKVIDSTAEIRGILGEAPSS